MTKIQEEYFNLTDTARWHPSPVVPNIVHYTWFSGSGKTKDDAFQFHHHMSVLSAYRFIKPVVIYFWCDKEPTGGWWNNTADTVPILTVKHMKRPDKVFGVEIADYDHKTDVARLDILLEHGGIYMDLDFMAFSSWEPLLHYELTLPALLHTQEKLRALENSVIIARKKSSFLNEWKKSYQFFHQHDYGFNSLVFPYNLAHAHPKEIHVEFNTLVHPIWQERHAIYSSLIKFDWCQGYGMHLWYDYYREEHSPQSIKTLDSVLGEIYRYVYYGSPDLQT